MDTIFVRFNFFLLIFYRTYTMDPPPLPETPQKRQRLTITLPNALSHHRLPSHNEYLFIQDIPSSRPSSPRRTIRASEADFVRSPRTTEFKIQSPKKSDGLINAVRENDTNDIHKFFSNPKADPNYQ